MKYYKISQLSLAAAAVVVVVLLVGMCSPGVNGDDDEHYRSGRVPRCGEGHWFFRDYMKCDASLSYCFEYRNQSCVGPHNWGCVHSLNNYAAVDGSRSNVRIKNEGYGNSRCCVGRYQSAIDIPAYGARCMRSMPVPTYLNPQHTLLGTYENSGYYSKFFVAADRYNEPVVLGNVPFSCSVPGSDQYVFANIHVHAGIKTLHGSAHFVQGKAYDGEIHLVNMRKDFWQPGTMDMRCASQTPLGLTVIAVFLSLTEGEGNGELNRIISHWNMEKIKESHVQCPYDNMCAMNNGIDYCRRTGDDKRKRDGNGWKGGMDTWRGDPQMGGTDGQVVCFCRRHGYEERAMHYAREGEERECRRKYANGRPMANDANHAWTRHVPCHPHANGPPCGSGVVEDFSLRPGLLLPRSSDYYQYFGSLTTPPCSEVVNWIIMKEPIRITQQQLDNLHLLKSRRQGDYISKYGDVRPVQPLNGRTVMTNSC